MRAGVSRRVNFALGLLRFGLTVDQVVEACTAARRGDVAFRALRWLKLIWGVYAENHVRVVEARPVFNGQISQLLLWRRLPEWGVAGSDKFQKQRLAPSDIRLAAQHGTNPDKQAALIHHVSRARLEFLPVAAVLIFKSAQHGR